MTTFTDCSTALDIASSWKKSKTLSHHSSQSDSLRLVDQASQSVDSRDTMIQTDKERTISKQDLRISVDYSSLQSFLNSVETIMSNQLLENAKSTAFQGHLC